MARVGRLAVLAIALAARLQAQTMGPAGALSPSRVEAIETAVASTLAEAGIPGLSLALATGGEIRLTGGYGLSDVENGVVAKPITVYRLASLSKPITAVAVLQLAEKGALDLDAPIQKYCPAFPEKPHPITARLLLAHLGGVRHYLDHEAVNTRRFGALVDGLSFFKDDPLAADPGTKYVYSTYGYSLLGCAVEGAGGRPFADYLRENVFGPAGMEHTRTDDARALIPNRAQGYVREASGALLNAGLADTSYKVPGGGLAGTAPDEARFVLALAGGSLLKKETLVRMLTRQKTRDGRTVGYGFGWSLADRTGRREVWHTGGQERVSTLLYWQPDSTFVVALLSNLQGAQPALLDLVRRLADLVQGDPASPTLDTKPRPAATPR